MRQAGSGAPDGGLRLGWKTPLLVVSLVSLVLSFSGQGAAQSGATFTINTTDNTQDNVCDVTHCSLLDAWYESEHHAGKDTIAFDIPGPAPHVIQPSASLVAGDPVDILGDTQPDWSVGHPTVVIDGTSIAGGGSGELELDGGNSTIRGLVIGGNSLPAIALEALPSVLPVGGNVVEGNFIGTDWTGTVAVPTGSGVQVSPHFVLLPGALACGEGCNGGPTTGSAARTRRSET